MTAASWPDRLVCTRVGFHCSHEQFASAHLLERLARCAELGVDAMFLDNVGRNQEAFIDAFGEAVVSSLVGDQR